MYKSAHFKPTQNQRSNINFQKITIVRKRNMYIVYMLRIYPCCHRSTTTACLSNAATTVIMPEPNQGAAREEMGHQVPVDRLEHSSLSTKWVVRSSEPSQQGAVVVNPEATAVTNSFPSKPVNFVMIFGPSKSGKSFFMNALARRDGIFGVSPAAMPCTSGVDLSKTVVSLQDFTGITTHVEPGYTPCVGFVDVEGLGDKNPSHHVKLAIPPMLVSKVLKRQLGWRLLQSLASCRRNTPFHSARTLYHALIT